MAERRLLGCALFVNYFLIAQAIAQVRAKICFAFLFGLTSVRILNVSLHGHTYILLHRMYA